LRLEDVFSYYEGRKFAAFLSNVPESVIAEITHRINTAIEEQVIKFSQKIIPLSVVFGAANYQITAGAEKSPNALALELLAAADVKLYAAKYNHASSAKKEKSA
jgi:GGDEF domain-containing protein